MIAAVIQTEDAMRQLLAILLLGTTLGCGSDINGKGEGVASVQEAAQVAKPSPNRNSPDAPDSEWRTSLFENAKELRNVPSVTVVSVEAGTVKVSVANVGKTALQYYSAGVDHVQTYQEIHEDGKWFMNNWDWCGTGKKMYEIPPDSP